MKYDKVMLWVSVCLLSVACGVMLENLHQRNRDNIVIKNISTVNRTVDYNNVSINADMTFFWVDTHSKRNDFSDERICMGTKLHLALMESVKHCENKDIAIGHKNYLYFYTYLLTNFCKTEGPFNEGRDWVSLSIKSITYLTKEKQYITFNFDYGSGRFVNPYYKENYYFKTKYFPDK